MSDRELIGETMFTLRYAFVQIQDVPRSDDIIIEYSRIAADISFARLGTECMLNHTRSESGAMLFGSKSGMLSYKFIKLLS